MTELDMSMTARMYTGGLAQQPVSILTQKHNWNLDSNKASCLVQTEVGRLWAKINSVADDVDHLKQTVPKQASIGGLSNM